MKQQLKNLMYGAILALPCSTFAQSFSENFGSVGSTSTIAQAAPGFANPGFTYSGTADVRNTAPSTTAAATGYSSASGNANVFFTNTVGKFFQIENINTSALTTPSFTFGISKSTTAGTGANFLIEISTDGVTYTALSYATLPTGSGTAHWYARTAAGTIPSVTNLRIRFTNNDASTQYRLDDINLGGSGTGPACSASITAGGNTTFCAGSSVLLTASTGASYLWSNGATTQTISANQSATYNVTVTAAGGCTAAASAPVRVLVYPTPTVAASATPAVICAGGSATLASRTLAKDLFFSEYVEGPSNEKYIEIYNGTGAAVNLINYVYQAYHNGTVTPTFTLQLTGTINDNDVLVLRNPAAVFYTGSSVSTGTVNHNGNDALALYNSTTSQFADIFGVIGVNPVSSWNGAGPISTLAQTLRRKPSVYSGITVNPALPGQSGFSTLVSEWDAFVSGNVSGLGAHVMDATVYAWSNGATGNAIVVTPTASGVYTVSGSYSVSGCSSTATVQVNVAEAFSAAIDNDATDITLCYGTQCANLTAVILSGGTAPFSYVWSTGTTTDVAVVCPTVTSSYTVDVTDANGCVSTATTAVNVINACCEATNVIVCTASGTICTEPSNVPALLTNPENSVGPCTAGGRIAAPKAARSSVRGNAPVLSAYPNPFMDVTAFEVKLAEGSSVKIEVMDYTGKKVAELNNSVLAAGTYTFNWNGTNANGTSVASGLYLCKITSGENVQTIKIQRASN